MVRKIELESWPRKNHYLFFRDYEFPYFSLCADVDLSSFLPRVKQKEASLTAAMMYLIARTANGIPEFRQRVREEGPIEHPVVHPSVTILSENDLFAFCSVTYEADFSAFIRRAEAEIARVKEQPSLTETIQDDSMLFMSAIPWVKFTSFAHPLKLIPADSVPRFAWGKFQETDGRVMMPLSVQGHHALMDGLHVGMFYQKFQELLDHPERIEGF